MNTMTLEIIEVTLWGKWRVIQTKLRPHFYVV